MYDPSGLYVDPILSGFSVGYQDQQLYGHRLAPETPVSALSGRYRVFDRSNWLIFPDTRAPGTVANEVVGRKWSEDTTRLPSMLSSLRSLTRKGKFSPLTVLSPLTRMQAIWTLARSVTLPSLSPGRFSLSMRSSLPTRSAIRRTTPVTTRSRCRVLHGGTTTPVVPLLRPIPLRISRPLLCGFASIPVVGPTR